MHISLDDEFPDLGLLNIEHAGKSVKIELGFYKSRMKETEAMFRDINAFWAWRGDDEGAQIFALFEQVADSIDNTHHVGHKFKEINNAVQALSKLHEVSLIEHWAKTRSNIRYPDNLTTELEESWKKEQTYFKDEYYELTAMSIAFKFMVPIWGAYLSGRSGDGDIFPEKRALGLLNRTTLKESAAYTRLEEFVHFILSNGEAEATAGALLQGIGTLDLPDWMFSLIVVERLAPATLSHQDDGEGVNATSLIANLFNHIGTRLAGLEKKTSFRVNNKNPERGTRNEEDNTSIAEVYTLRHNLSEPQLAIFDYFTEDMERLARQVKEDIDVDHVRQLVAINLRRKKLNHEEWQLRLAGLVTRKVISPRAYGYINREGTMNLISIAQVTLHEWGYSTVAELISGQMVTHQNVLGDGMRTSRDKVRDHREQALNALLPHKRMVKPARGQKAVEKNPAILAIDRIMQAVSGKFWDTEVTDVIAEKSEMIKTPSGRRAPFDMSNILADLIIQLNNKN